MSGPLDRLTSALPAPWDTIADWAITIAIAVAAVLAIKAWVVNPYRIPSSSMEPTLHCAAPEPGCQADSSDRVLANRFIYRFRDPERGDIVVFNTPESAVARCGAGGTFVKRLVGLPGDRWREQNGFIYINGERLEEPYVQRERRDHDTIPEKTIPDGEYLMLGDNRASSCDSRRWGTVPRDNLIGPVFAIYWPPSRIGFE